jgi:ankyrin repeat protein
MIENNAPLDSAGDHHKSLSALGVAVASGNNSVIPRLLGLGARSGLESPCPVEQAIYTNQPQLVELLLKHGIRPISDNGLCHIVRRNDKSLLQLLLRYGLKLEFYGIAPLFIAIMEGQYEMVEMLIDNGAKPYLLHMLQTRDEDGFDDICQLSPIEFAIHFRRLDILKLLLEKGLPAQVDLDLAANKKYEEAVILLSKFSGQSLPAMQTVDTYILWTQYDNGMEDPDFQMPWTSWILDDPITPALCRSRYGIACLELLGVDIE